MYFYKPTIKNPLSDDEILNRNMYFCSQTLIKIHPHFDEILSKILSTDKKAKIIFIKDEHSVLTKKLLARFSSNKLIDLDRINFIERLGVQDYINLCGSSSVILDTLYYGSGNSFHESMYYGTPTVTFPNEYTKSRIAYAAYKQMKIENPPITNSIDSYVNKAVELANIKRNESLEIKKHYSKSADKYLFENRKFITELENFLENLG